MAQVYNHMIMPLAGPRDRRMQVRWGVEDFEARFGRSPEGMWLPETAADTDSLEAMAECGIKFTLLSPHQAAAVKAQGDKDWTSVPDGRLDTRKAYSCALPSGRRIALFFFDRGISNNIAFGDLLDGGEKLARALLGGFSTSGGSQLVNVASDGETYGHHHKRGHLSLADCISRIEKGGAAELTNYGMFLEVEPPSMEVRIFDGTSWSCPHGVERWRSNCGCGSEIRPGYNQEWRAPLRASLDWLGARLAAVYDSQAPLLFRDANRALDSPPSTATSPGSRAGLAPKISAADRKGAQDLLRMVECAALMQASCAWFWEEISRMEPVQALRFASRAMELASGLTGQRLEPEFERLLSRAKPNDRHFRTGAQLYEELAARKRAQA